MKSGIILSTTEIAHGDYISNEELVFDLYKLLIFVFGKSLAVTKSPRMGVI